MSGILHIDPLNSGNLAYSSPNSVNYADLMLSQDFKSDIFEGLAESTSTGVLRTSASSEESKTAEKEVVQTADKVERLCPFRRLFRWTKGTAPYKFCEKHGPIVAAGAAFLSNLVNLIAKIAEVANRAFRVIETTDQGSNDHWFSRLPIEKATLIIKGIGSCIALPLSVLQIYSNINALVHAQNLSEGVDHGFELVGSIGYVGTSVASVINDTRALHLIGSGALTWSGPLLIVGAFMQVPGLLIHTKQFIQGLVFEKELDAIAPRKGEINETQFENAVNKIEELRPHQVKHYLGIEKSKLQDRLKNILKTLQSKDVNESVKASTKQKMQKVYKELRKRITHQNWSHALQILASVISIIGLAILFFTPLQALAYIALTIGGSISLICMIYNLIDSGKLNRILNEAAPQPEA